MPLPLYQRKILIGVLLFCLLIITFYIRIQGIGHLSNLQFTGNDAYLYHWQAGIISEHGNLPARDMHRWLPVGRDNGQLLPLYAYAIAYTHKALPWLSLYHIQLYLPTLCFTLALGMLFLLFVRTNGVLFATIVALLLATLPGSVERSAAGFGDRDAWCWMFGVLSVASYLWKEHKQPGIYRYIVTATSGVTVFLGGLSWEAFGIFVFIIHVVELYKFCTTDTEEHLKEYLLYILMFVPGLYLISSAYRSGYGLSTHTAALTLYPPIAIFALRGTRYMLLRYYAPLRFHARKISWCLSLFTIAAVGGYILYHTNDFETTAFVLQESRLMKDMTELADPHYGYWTSRYGAVFLLGSLGIILATSTLYKWNGLPLTFSLVFFTVTTFFREPFSRWIGTTFFGEQATSWTRLISLQETTSEWTGVGVCDTLFFISFGLIALSLAITCIRKEYTKDEWVPLAMLSWFLLWVALSRGGKRYDFFIGIPIAYGTAWILYTLSTSAIQKFPLQKQKLQWIPTAFATAVLIPILFFNPFGGHATRATDAATKWRKPVVGHNTPLAQTLKFLNTSLPENVVVAANWNYGSRLNVFGGVNTITDQDTFIPHWIYLYYRHVYCAQSAREALTFLKTHGATHLMLTEWGLTIKAKRYSNIGSNENLDRQFKVTKLILLQEMHFPSTVNTPIQYIEPPDITSQPKYLTAHLKNGDMTQLPYVAFQGRTRIASNTYSDDTAYGSVILYYNDESTLEKALHVPTIGWQSLAVRLYFSGDLQDIFFPIYPTNGDDTAPIKIWEIRYPSDIKTDEIYLTTQTAERVAQQKTRNRQKQ